MTVIVARMAARDHDWRPEGRLFRCAGCGILARDPSAVAMPCEEMAREVKDGRRWRWRGRERGQDGRQA